MLRVLLAKDLRRTWRNPMPVLINLALPLCITALISLAFGEKKQDTALGRIRIAIVDEDDTILTGMLRSAVTRREALQHLDPLFLDRPVAMQMIGEGKIAAVLAIPTNFTRHYFDKTQPVSLELIKNPAQAIHPTVVEEAASGMVTALDALARNFPWQADEKLDVRRIGTTLGEFARRFDKTNESYFAFITSDTEEPAAKPRTAAEPREPAQASTGGGTNQTSAPLARPADAGTTQEKPSETTKARPPPDLSIFGYILAGMAAMFLLFIASAAMTDLQRELRFRTLERYQTLRHALLPFILSKVIFTLVLVLICAAIMLGGGAFAFGIRWTRPLELALLTVGYGCFAAGMMSLMVALMPGERRSSTLNDMASMFLALAGGCMFPVRQLPEFLRNHVSPLLPSYWYVETARELQAGNLAIPWTLALVKLLALGLLFIGMATWLYGRRFRSGLRA